MQKTTLLPYAGAPNLNGSSEPVSPSGPSKVETALAEAKAEAAKYRRLSQNQQRAMATVLKVLRPYTVDE